MKNESINKLMRKYHGPTGAFLHRLVVFLGSVARLVILLPALLLSRLGSGKSRVDRGASTAKQKLAMLWAIGLKRPFVANTR
jgi:hypothetical protein